jgi:hypothetical protein
LLSRLVTANGALVLDAVFTARLPSGLTISALTRRSNLSKR